MPNEPLLPMPLPEPPARRHHDELPLVGVANTLLRQRGLLTLVVLLTVGGALAWSLARPRTYTSVSAFMPQERQSPSGNLAGLAAQFGVNLPLGEASETPAFYIELIRSREVLGAVVDAEYTGVRRGRPFQGTLVEWYAPRGSTEPLRREKAIERLDRRIAAAELQKSGLVRFSVRTHDAQVSQQVNARVLDLLNRFNLDRRMSEARAEREFIEQRFAEVRGELRGAEDALSRFLQQNRVINLPYLQFEEERLAREVRLQERVFGSLAEMLEQARIEEVRATPVITVIEPPRAPVRPDTRALGSLIVLAALFGLLLGAVLAYARDTLAGDRAPGSQELREFEALRRETLADLRRPWRLLRLQRVKANGTEIARAS
jgi:uncharacterized protein involved in exopolysaccharide biosynthesis